MLRQSNSSTHLASLAPFSQIYAWIKTSVTLCLQMTHLANACTQEDPKLRPTMRSVVVALMTLSSTSEFWDMNALYENPGLVNLMSGR